MLKDNLIKYVKKFVDDVKGNEEPYTIYTNLKKNEVVSDFIKYKLKGLDLVLFLFLLAEPNSTDDEFSNLYDEILNKLTYIEVAQITSEYSESECYTCDGGRTIECEDCSGTGEDSEGEPCDTCQGGGEVLCDTCEGSGEYRDYESAEITIYKYLTYNDELIDSLSELSEDDEIGSFDVDYDTKTLYVDADYENTGVYSGSEGDYFLRYFLENPTIEYSERKNDLNIKVT